MALSKLTVLQQSSKSKGDLERLEVGRQVGLQALALVLTELGLADNGAVKAGQALFADVGRLWGVRQTKSS